MNAIVHSDAVGFATDTNNIFLGHAQQICTGKIGKRW